MIHTSRDAEPNSERFFLIEVVAQHGTKQIVARVVRKAVAHQYNEEGRCVSYQDSNPKEANGYRNATWSNSNKTGLFVDNFGLSGFIGDVAGLKREVYGVDVVYSNVYRVDAETAAQMGKTFRAVQKNLHKQDSLYGYVDANDYASRLLRLAAALGITKFLTYNRSTDSLENSTFDVHSAIYLSDVVANIFKKATQ